MISLSWSGDDLSRERSAPNNHSEANAPRESHFDSQTPSLSRAQEDPKPLESDISSKCHPCIKTPTSPNQPNQTNPTQSRLPTSTIGYQTNYANIKRTLPHSSRIPRRNSRLLRNIMSSTKKLQDLVHDSAGVTAGEHLTDNTLGLLSLLNS